jgi:hypothetical protein
MDNGIKRPLITAGLFFAIAKCYTTSQNSDVPVSAQLVVSGVLGASAWAAEQANRDNPAVKALTTGSLFAGAMYLGLGSERVLTHAVLGTITAYAAELIAPDEKEREEEVNEFSQFA